MKHLEIPKEIHQFLTKTIDEEIDLYEAYLDVKEFIEYVDNIKDTISKSLINKLHREEKSKLETKGYIFAVSCRTIWNYSKVKAWNEKKKELEVIQEQSKAAYILSQNQFESDFEGIANASTGELIDIAIPVKSDDFITIKKLKND